MDTIFMNFENSKTSNPHRISLSKNSIFQIKKFKKEWKIRFIIKSSHFLYMKKYKKSYTKTINLKYKVHRGMIYLN